MRIRARWWCAAALLGAAPICLADVVLLANGDRVSGQITGLQSEKLTLKTEFAGDIQIDWKKVVQISSDAAYDVEADSGRKFRGALLFSGDGVAVSTPEGRVPLPLFSVKGISVPVENEGLLTPLHGTVDLGYNFARGNSNLSTSSVAINSRYRREKFQIQTELASLFSRQLDSPSNSRHYGSLRFDRFVSTNSFWFLLGGLERDERRQLNLRTNLGGGLGRTLVKNAHSEASVLGGFTFVEEQFSRDAKLDDPKAGGPTGEGLFALDMRRSLFAGVVATNRISLHPNLVTLGRYRLALESGVRLPLMTRYVWSIQLFNRFDSKPPVAARRNDYGAVSSFGVSF